MQPELQGLDDIYPIGVLPCGQGGLQVHMREVEPPGDPQDGREGCIDARVPLK